MSLSSYIAGLHLQLTETQTFNGIGWVACGTACYLTWPGSNYVKKVEKEGGRRIELPHGIRIKAQVLTAVHGLGMLVPAAAFIVSLPLNQFITPDWLAKCTLPPVLPPLAHDGLRIAGCVGAIGIGFATLSGFKHLGSQWNYLGLREKPKLVNTGPYSVVRHPMYSYAMLLEVCFAGMFWNWMPLAVLGGVLVPTFIIKIPLEERVILESKKIGKEYRGYQKTVRWRVCPYLW